MSGVPKDDIEYQLSITRPVYTQKQFQSEFALDKSERLCKKDDGTDEDDEEEDEDNANTTVSSTARTKTRTGAKNRIFGPKCAGFHRFFDRYLHPKHLLGVFTILNLITEYNFKECFLADVFSGLTGEIFKGLIKTTLSTYVL